MNCPQCLQNKFQALVDPLITSTACHGPRNPQGHPAESRQLPTAECYCGDPAAPPAQVQHQQAQFSAESRLLCFGAAAK